MSRPAPRIDLSAITVGVLLDPNGAHQLVIEGPAHMVAMKFNVAQVDVLDRAIDDFRTRIVQADAGPDFHKQMFKPLAVG